jgi:anthranilate phosphoribosyltransferase
MTNPAGAKRQVIGVFSDQWQRPVAQVLQLLGSEHAMVVHSQGLDEIRLDAPTHIVELKHGDIAEYDISPADFGIGPRTAEEYGG